MPVEARHNPTSDRCAHSGKLAKRAREDDEKLDAKRAREDDEKLDATRAREDDEKLDATRAREDDEKLDAKRAREDDEKLDAKRPQEDDEKLDAHRRVAQSVKSALSGPLRNHKFTNTKGSMAMDVGNVCLHFPGNECLQVENASKLAFVHDTPAYVPETGPLPVAEITVGFEFHVPNFAVDDNAAFMAALRTLLLITCTTPIDDVRVELWSNSVGTLGTRGFAVEPCLQATQDPYAPGPHCSGGPHFVENQFGNVMQFKLQSTSCLSFTLRDGEWKLSLMWLW